MTLVQQSSYLKEIIMLSNKRRNDCFYGSFICIFFWFYSDSNYTDINPFSYKANIIYNINSAYIPTINVKKRKAM